MIKGFLAHLQGPSSFFSVFQGNVTGSSFRYVICHLMDLILQHGAHFWPHCGAVLLKYFSLMSTLVVAYFLVAFNVLCVLVIVQMSEVSLSVCLFLYVRVSFSASVCRLVCLSVCLSACMFDSVPDCRSVSLVVSGCPSLPRNFHDSLCIAFVLSMSCTSEFMGQMHPSQNQMNEKWIAVQWLQPLIFTEASSWQTTFIHSHCIVQQ